MRRIIHVLNSVLIASVLCAGVSKAADAAAPNEDALIAVLASQAPVKDKADACRQLGLIGTGKSVPALAALLGDEQLSHMARYALEPIPDKAVDVALRAALATLKGRALAGVIGSIGVRRDTAATASLGALLQSADADVAQAAARSLGKLGTVEAVEQLQKALPGASAKNRLAVCEGLLRCAEALAAGGRRAEAAAVYDGLRGVKDAPHQVLTAALRGAVLARQDAGLPLLLEACRDKDFLLVKAAARTSIEMPGAKVTEALAGALDGLASDSQVVLIQALGKRGDKAALPALCALAKTGGKATREAIVHALVEIGGAAAVPALVALTSDIADDVVKAARNALGAMEGSEIDAALLAMLNDRDPKTRGVAIDLIGQRRTIAAIPALLEAAGAGDESIRIATVKAVGEMAGVAQFPALVKLLVAAKSAAEVQAAENVLVQVCERHTRLAPGEVTIKSAVYGDLPNGASADVTAKVAAIVRQGSLVVEASNANFGDPAQGARKKLRVEYTAGGAAKTETVNEGQVLRFSGGATPQAFIDALRAAADQAPPEPKEALLRVLKQTRAPAR